ncbi:PadR family transcriptional regulator [Armatimonas rosea]|uniref:DNA-binding PadR family transcriptional regulator n=1 Tax=Armatimonas rosea TaxID=685828 RepID=A0A7W9WA17_ARMRO|nr:PadR family transcriptional regulator [Armatimonas rosea]MBB6053820.1 DNA-binding PadR family transcriptional regulator [Armatimonas rosea]
MKNTDHDEKISTPEGEAFAVDHLVREIFLAFVKVHLLHHAAEAPIYGIEMIDELTHHGYKIGPGTIYPTLHRLRSKGYLTEEKRVVNGKVRKYYHITELGREALSQLRPKVRELVGEVLEERENT